MPSCDLDRSAGSHTGNHLPSSLPASTLLPKAQWLAGEKRTACGRDCAGGAGHQPPTRSDDEWRCACRALTWTGCCRVKSQLARCVFIAKTPPVVGCSPRLPGPPPSGFHYRSVQSAYSSLRLTPASSFLSMPMSAQSSRGRLSMASDTGGGGWGTRTSWTQCHSGCWPRWAVSARQWRGGDALQPRARSTTS